MKHTLAVLLALTMLLIGTQPVCGMETNDQDNSKKEGDLCCGTKLELMEELSDSLLEKKNSEFCQNANAAPYSFIETTHYRSSLMPSTGNVRILVLPIEFSNYKMTDSANKESHENLEKVFFDPYDPEKKLVDQSVRGFYHQSSYGKLDIRGDILPVYTAPQTNEFYSTSAGDWSDCVKTALSYYVEKGLDLAKYDSDKDGKLDGLCVVTAGSETTIPYGETRLGCEVRAFDYSSADIKIKNFMFVPVYSSVEVRSHEIGHLLGLQDNYRKPYDCFLSASLSEIMHSGLYFNVYYKWLLGWIEPRILTNENTPEETVELSAVESYTDESGNECKAVVLVPDPDMLPFTEFYIAEYRVGGTGESVFGYEFSNHPGIVLWHCYTELNSSHQYHDKQRYIQPVCRSGSEKFGATDVYTKGNVFSSTSKPANSDFYDSYYTGAYLKVESISGEKATIKAGFRDPDLSPGPVIHISGPSLKATKNKPVEFMVTVTEGVNGRVIPYEELTLNYSKMKSTETGTISSILFSSRKENPFPLTFEGSSYSPSWGNGTIQYTLESGFITYNRKKSHQAAFDLFYFDDTKPEITLTGDDPQIIELGKEYQELGAIVTDNLDPDIESKLVIDTSKVDTNRLGTYLVIYSATDHAENAANIKTRMVKVVESMPPPADIITQPAAKDLTYTGSAQELLTPGEAEGGALLYGLDENGGYSLDIPTGVNAGEYTVWYRVIGDAEHSSLPPVSLPVTIAKAARPENIPADISVPDGTALSSLRLPDGWSWKTPGQTLSTGANTVAVVYADTQNYEQTEFTITVTMAEPVHTHSLTKTAAKEATCTAEGNLEYWTCSGCGSVFEDGSAATPTTVAERTLEKLAHTPGLAATCTEDQSCTVCGKVLEEKLGHDYKDTVTPPTCTEKGYTTHTCSRCQDSYTDSETKALEHSWGPWTQTKAPSTTETGEERRECSRCGAFETQELPMHVHIEEVLPAVPATCTQTGLTEGLRCSVCGTMLQKQEVTPVLGHAFGEWKQTKAPSCTENGEEKRSCSRCGYSETRAISAKGHTPGPEATCTENQTCTVCGVIIEKAKGHIPGEWKVVTPATTTQEGLKQKECTVCHAVLETERIPKESQPVTPPSPPVPPGPGPVNPGPVEPDPPTPTELPFTDVKEGAWYYEAVSWAYGKEVISGTSKTTFSPNMTTTRGMIVTILWRLEGKPQSHAAMTFTDVKPGTYYYEAVRWAAEHEIVSGRSKTCFDPNAPISRQELAAILYRYAGSPATGGTLSGFADGGNASNYARKSLCWAVEKGILSGKGNNVLDPRGKATRAETASMLMRYIGE